MNNLKQKKLGILAKNINIRVKKKSYHITRKRCFKYLIECHTETPHNVRRY